MSRSEKVGSIAAVGIALIVVVLASRWINGILRSPGELLAVCLPPDGLAIDIGSAGFDECVSQRAKLFVEHDYAEMKDLSKAFLTLLTAVFVASITFSEKIVNFHSVWRGPKYAMAVCWSLLLVAISAVGGALALMTVGLGYAVYSPAYDYVSVESEAVTLFVASGLSFGAALTAMLVAATLTVMKQSALSADVTQAPSAVRHGTEGTGEVVQKAEVN